MKDDTEIRRLAAIMFTDMVGYSAQQNEALALELLNEQQAIVRSIFPKHGGVEVKTMGDGFLVQFSSALSASLCAVEIQKVLADRNVAVPELRRIQLRIGVHLGDVIHREGDVYGDGVNIAARLEPLAQPGGICISEDVARQIHNKIEQSVVGVGKVGLKNITRPVEVFHIVVSPETVPEPLSGSAPPNRRSIAVLPFVNMSADRENEFLSDGITEDLITALSQVQGLHVPARTSAFAFKGRSEDVRRIGERLNVANVLEGSLRKAGNRLRVTAQLVDVTNGYHLWSEKYDRDMEDVFAIQDEITAAIVTALRPHLGEHVAAPATRKPTQNTEAYQLYLKGRFHWNQRGGGLPKALHYFELARLEDPHYAPAYAGLADALLLLAYYGHLPANEAAPKAREHALRAVALDPLLAEPHSALGFISLLYDWNLGEAEASFQHARQLNPKFLQAILWHSSVAILYQDYERFRSEAARAIELDPLSPLTHAHNASLELAFGRFEPARIAAEKSLELNPEFLLGHWWLGQALSHLDRHEEAVRTLRAASEASGGVPWLRATLAWALARAGRKDEALKELEALHDQAGKGYVRPFLSARVHAALGNRDAALRCLETAALEHDFRMAFLHFDGGGFETLRGHPRFDALIEMIGMASSAKKATTIGGKVMKSG